MLATMVDDLRSWRDRAILVLGFASGCRRAELAALDLVDATLAPAEQGLIVYLRKSKTDQEMRGRQIGIQRGEHEATCPVRVLVRWIRERGAWTGPLFCRVGQAGQITRARLSPAAIACVVKAAARRAGLDPGLYAGHSLRAGCATSASADLAPGMVARAKTATCTIQSKIG